MDPYLPVSICTVHQYMLPGTGVERAAVAGPRNRPRGAPLLSGCQQLSGGAWWQSSRHYLPHRPLNRNLVTQGHNIQTFFPTSPLLSCSSSYPIPQTTASEHTHRSQLDQQSNHGGPQADFPAMQGRQEGMCPSSFSSPLLCSARARAYVPLPRTAFTNTLAPRNRVPWSHM